VDALEPADTDPVIENHRAGGRTETGTDVLVVGAGPVGMCLALDLCSRGVRTLVVDAGDGRVEHPKVGTVGPRSMELFRRWGVADAVRGAGWPADHSLDVAWVTAVGGHEIHRIRFGTVASRRPLPYTPEPEQVCPQHWLAPILTSHVEAAGAAVRYGQRVERVVPGDDGVVATVRDTATGRLATVEASYLAACDGAGSGVRKQLGVAAPSYFAPQVFRNILFRAPELRSRLGAREALVHFLTSPSLLRYPLRSMDGVQLYRLTAAGTDESATRPAADLVAEAIAFPTPIEIVSENVWHLTHTIADRYRVGRVFFVGDAAHTLSPSGGFGMNTGIADAADLGWKLAAAVHGWAGPALLDHYETERRPVAEAALRHSEANLRRTTRRVVPPEVTLDTEEGRRTREALGRRLREAGVEREFDAPQVHFGYRYASPLVVPDRATGPDCGPDCGPDEDWAGSAVPGGRAPHAWTAPGRSVLDLYGVGFVLMASPAAPDPGALDRAFRHRGVPLARHDVTAPAVAEVYGPRHVLVRPDGGVAWRGTHLPPDPLDLIDRVRGAR
jgi:flavin-dependent monooxygenase StaC